MSSMIKACTASSRVIVDSTRTRTRRSTLRSGHGVGTTKCSSDRCALTSAPVSSSAPAVQRCFVPRVTAVRHGSPRTPSPDRHDPMPGPGLRDGPGTVLAAWPDRGDSHPSLGWFDSSLPPSRHRVAASGSSRLSRGTKNITLKGRAHPRPV